MSQGFPATKQELDGAAGVAVLNLSKALQAVNDLKLRLDKYQDADLTALGYDSNGLTAIRANFAAFAQLYAVAHGQAAQPGASDFFFDAWKLTGFVV